MWWFVTCVLLPMAYVIGQPTGPCKLQNNGMACTRNGYFEMTQCNNKECFCVSAHDGRIAEDTRSKGPRIVPTCSKCHLKLREIFASSSRSPDAYVPVCDNKNGDYERVQCHPAKRECWCAQPESGEEIADTRRVNSNENVMNCGGAAKGRTHKRRPPKKRPVGVRRRKNCRKFFLGRKYHRQHRPTFSRFPATNASTFMGRKRVEYPVAKESCKLSSDKGQRCYGKQPTVMWYFDSEHANCFAFEYLGCGGNENKYRSTKECHSACNLPDMSGCSGSIESAGQCNPNDGGMVPQPPGFPHGIMEKPCPQGYRCQMGAFFGFCCPIDTEEAYNKAYNPECPNKYERVHQDHNGDWEETRLGRLCSDNFCPTNKRCHQGEIFAFCC